MNLGIAGRLAIVTGGANGIGAAVATRLADEGAAVVIADIDLFAAQRTAHALTSRGKTAVPIALDVTNELSVASMMSDIAPLGRPQILVNNAGFTRDMRITKMQTGDWDAVVNVVLKGAFLCTRAVLPQMTEQRWGRIVNISSRAHLGNAGQANYSAAKAGILGFTRAMSLENAKYGVTVNAVAPGIIATEAVTSLPHFPKIRENAEKTTPVPRLGQPDDVATVVAFLASECASYVSGDVWHVSGGRY